MKFFFALLASLSTLHSAQAVGSFSPRFFNVNGGGCDIDVNGCITNMLPGGGYGAVPLPGTSYTGNSTSQVCVWELTGGDAALDVETFDLDFNDTLFVTVPVPETTRLRQRHRQLAALGPGNYTFHNILSPHNLTVPDGTRFNFTAKANSTFPGFRICPATPMTDQGSHPDAPLVTLRFANGAGHACTIDSSGCIVESDTKPPGYAYTTQALCVFDARTDIDLSFDEFDLHGNSVVDIMLPDNRERVPLVTYGSFDTPPTTCVPTQHRVVWRAKQGTGTGIKICPTVAVSPCP